MVSGEKNQTCFSYISYVNHVTPRGALLGHNFKKLGTGLLGDASYKISRLYAMGFRQEDFFMFSVSKFMLNM